MIVYLSEHIHPSAVEKLKSYAKVVDTFEEIEKIDAIILRNIDVTKEMIQKAKKLKVIGKHGVGCNTIDLEAAKENTVKVLNTPTANADSVAEMITGLFIMMSRRVYEANLKSRRGEFESVAPSDFLGTELSGKVLGLIGVGNIGQRVASILRNGFNVEVICYDPFLSQERAEELELKKVETLKELLRNSDLVNISVPLTKDTKNLVSGNVFDYFKPNAILVNAARGGIVNEEDLYHALVNKKLQGAACDAFVEEPPTSENKLLSLENFSATPHIGGNTEEALFRAGMQVVDNVINILEGKPAKGLVIG
ncbi:hydroxyacid dehydrogenase [uncultured Planococcus sp.]|uniref:hydroxyacid dehydrogenase n=1 Tax=Planococcus donghaensis TaxID=414778 RepID=UPI00261BE768|nr:hydroxyacid dehydrogenase [uncultured Planococcus sp.]